MPKSEESTRRPAKGPRVAMAQLAPTLGDAAANLEQHRTAIARAVADGCDVIVFPELSLAGYRLKDSVPDVAITRGSDTWKELEKLSNDISIVAGFVEETPDHLFYNSAAWFEGGKTLAVHRKTYLPTYGMFDEQRYFARGRSIAAFDTRHGRVAMLVCEDMLHPSALTIAACDGATTIVVPSVSPARGVVASPAAPDEEAEETAPEVAEGSTGRADANARSWEAYLHTMARSFGVWVVYCNRVGVEDGVSFWGGSEIVSPAGERVAKAAYYDEDFTSAVLAEDAVRRRRIANPLVRDEDLDLTINELSRIRGRAVAKGAGDATSAAAPRPARPARDAADGEKPPRRFDREAEGAAPGPRFGSPRGGFGDRDRRGPRGEDDAPRFAQPRGRFGPRDRHDRDDAPGGGFAARQAPQAPRGKFAPRDRDDAPRGGFGPRDRGDAPPGRFDRGDAPRGRFGPRDRDDAPRGRFGPRDGEKPPGRFGPRDDRRGGFGARDRDDAPRGRFGAPAGGPRGGFAKPRGSFGAAGEGKPFGGKGRFGEGPSRPRERQRPDPMRKPFHKGAKPPRGGGRKDH